MTLFLNCASRAVGRAWESVGDLAHAVGNAMGMTPVQRRDGSSKCVVSPPQASRVQPRTSRRHALRTELFAY